MDEMRPYIGKVVREISGYTGIVIGYMLTYGSVGRLLVQAFSEKENEFPSSMWVDVTLVEVLENHPKQKDDFPFNPVETSIRLGSEVRDVATGFKGIVHAMTYYSGGCVHCSIVPNKLGKDGDYPKPALISAATLTEFGRGLLPADDAPVEEKEKMAKHARSGGPATAHVRPMF